MATQPDEKIPDQEQRNKKPYIIGAIILVALLFGGFAATKIFKSDNPKQQTATASPDPLGNAPISCLPKTDNDYYRTDRSLVIDPNNPQNLFVGVELKGAYQSADGGATWKQTLKDYKWKYSCFPEPFTAHIDPSNSKAIYLSASGEGIMKTTDGGATWKSTYTSAMFPRSEEFAFDPTNSKTIYATVENPRGSKQLSDNSNATKGLVYKTTDGGGSWTELTTPIVANAGNNGVFVSKKDNKHILAFTLLVHMTETQGRKIDTSGQLGILESKDTGNTWKSLHTLPPAYEATANVFASSRADNLYVAPLTSDGVPMQGYYSTDFGQSWKPSTYMYYVGYDPHDATGKHAIGFNKNALDPTPMLYETYDAGKTWAATIPAPPEVKSAGDHKTLISKIQWDPKAASTIYVTGAGGYVWKTSDAGKTWKTLLSLDTLPK